MGAGKLGVAKSGCECQGGPPCGARGTAHTAGSGPGGHLACPYPGGGTGVSAPKGGCHMFKAAGALPVFDKGAPLSLLSQNAYGLIVTIYLQVL